MKNQTVTPQTKFKTPYNNLNHGQGYEINVGDSMTLPDQSMTVQEIMRRYAMGLSLGGGRDPIYNEDQESLMNYEKMDKIEKIEVQRRYQQRLLEMDEDLKRQGKAKYDKDREKLINDEVEKRLKEKAQGPAGPVPPTGTGAGPSL